MGNIEGFGHKNVWFAVRGGDARAIAAALSLEVVGPCEWHDGVAAAYDFGSGDVFITPGVDGWVLCVGTGLFGHAEEHRFAGTTERISRLLGTEVQFFGTHRVVESHGWARATADGLQRAYMYVGDKGETVADIGALSREESALGFRFFDERSAEASQDGYWEREDLEFPSEDHVMRLAGRWSIDPTTLDGRELDVTAGLLCRDLPSVQQQQLANPAAAVPKPWWKFW